MNAFFSHSGASLRAAVAAGNPEAIAEQARRDAKTPKTIAALKSRGMVAEAQARIDAAQARKAAEKAAKAAAPVITPVVAIANRPKVVAFTRTSEAVAAPKGAIGNLHNRLCGMEQRQRALEAGQQAILAAVMEIGNTVRLLAK